MDYSGGKCVWSRVEMSVCGVQWRCVCVEYSGGECVWSTVEVSVCCGVQWR